MLGVLPATVVAGQAKTKRWSAVRRGHHDSLVL